MISMKCDMCDAVLLPEDKFYNTIDGIFCEICIRKYLEEKKMLKDLKDLGLLKDDG